MSQSECRCKGHVTLVASVLVLLAAAGVASGEFRIPRSLPAGGVSTAATNHTANPDGICPSMDIRNHVSALRELENCTVIEGFLQIVLIGQSNGSSEWQNYSFPNLREITDYLLLFRVFGLSSLRDLFPNLTLIRGQTLAYSHSLIIYEALQLREIGLASLTDIQRGSVMISKNPNLCYVDTVDWDRIAKGGKGYNYFKENADPKDCTPCPTHCPKGVDGRPLCWTNQDCQKVCQNCGKSSCTLTSGGVEACCDEVCLGGCRAPANASECHVCHNVTQNGSCRAKCIPGTYMFMQRRCVSDAECIRMPIPREVPQHERETFRWKPFNGECLKDCPTDHVETKEVGIDSKPYYTCKPCLGSCPKSCLGMMVINIERAQNLKGCTRIDGDLVIQVKGGDNIVKELEDNLGAIEEISGFLKIVRSYPLLSLNFLRNLRVIGGKNLESKRNALVVMENENLQELWNWETRSHKLRISNGSVLFHFNPKLCLDKIHDFLNVSMPNQTFSDLEVSPSSNGDKVACNLQELDLRLERVESEVVTLSWEKFRANDYRSLIRYIISLKEAPQQTVTYYDGRDACGGDGWRTIDVTPNTDDDPLQTDFIPNLKPFTQYAVYVRTLTVAGERPADRVGGRSKIVYFRTKATRPSSPENIIAYANSSTQLVIDWQPPRHPNGIVTFYIITGDFEEENKDYIDKVDYCQDHFLSFSGRGSVKPSTEATSLKETSVSPVAPYKPRSPSDSVTVSKSSEEECCVCGTGDKKSLQVNEEEHAFGTAFEDYLHNIIYVQGDYYGDDSGQSELRRKRSFDAHFMENEVAAPGDKGFSDFHPLLPFDSDVADVVVDVEDAYEDHYLRRFQRKVNETRITIKSLQPFSEYAISVKACHQPDPETNLTLCSKKAAVTTARTQPSEDGDRIPSEYLNVTSLNDTRSVMIHWHDPQQPNGIILRYDLKYQRVDLDGTRNPEPITKCIRRKEFSTSKRVYILRDLAPGNYSFTLRAVSRAGPGPFTNPVYHRITEVNSGLDGTVLAVILSVVFLVIFVLLAAGMVYYLRTKMNHSNVIVSLNPDYISTVYRQDEWEVDRGNVELLRELGQGSFGMVYEGIVRNLRGHLHEIRCAVKTVNEQASVGERIQFLNEASVMKKFSANHVVKLLGVVSLGQPTLVLMELMAKGDLKSYLRSHRPDCAENVSQGRHPPTLRCILKMAIEIADGMAYLADKKFVHRDLAARNCMVAEDLTVKIGDFGMTRDIYETDYYRKGGKGLLPVRWMAPESLRDGIFTTQSDIWSYGVVLWEMATLASQPYQGLSNEQVLKYVMDSGVMERPEGCPDRLYEIMEMCWHYQPRHRPSFLDIIENLLPDVPAQFSDQSFFHSDAGVSAREAQRAHQEQDRRVLHDPRTPLRTSQDGCSMRSRSSSQGSEADEDDRFVLSERLSLHDQALTIEEVDDRVDPNDSLAALEEQLTAESRDHVQVMLAHDRRPYVVVRNPQFVHNNSSNSKSDSSKGTTIPSEDSKGSYVSNGSAGNGYVMGILNHRRHGNAES